MPDIYDLQIDFTETTDKISYNFYESYLGSNLFREKLENRLSYIKQKYNCDSSTDNQMKENFMEIFSWSALNKSELLDLVKYIKSKDINYIIDPTCGNGFHSLLFQIYSSLEIRSNDKEKIPCSWVEAREKDGRDYIKGLNDKENEEGALILSGKYNDDMDLELLDLFKGNMVLHYRNDEISLPELNLDFKMKKRIIIEMPTMKREYIEIYIRKY